MTDSRNRADAFSFLLGAAADVAEGPQIIAVNRITVRDGQPRRHFDAEALTALTASIRSQGVLQPILVRPAKNGYELIAGERRLRAARLAGLAEIPATVRAVEDQDVSLLAALENLQRQDLNPLDEVEATLAIVGRAMGIEENKVIALLHAQRRTPDDATVKQLDTLFQQLGTGSWKSFAANKAGVLKFPPDLLELMRSGQLEYTRATAISKVKDEQQRRSLTRRALAEHLGVREIAAAAKGTVKSQKRYQHVKSLIDEKRISNLAVEERIRVDHLLEELEALLSGQDR
ncbi:ParB/RepB/Spo0J family partition protein [Deinococcus rubellus]|uniref:ParB/RepB/Spo0J family partition protein n=1 Tax=Deinococcus rubellus TaxID=1889240 RepID=UPI0031EAA4B4